VAQVQPWITSNMQFVGIVEEKLKYFSHDENYFTVSNFDFIYQRVKGLIENFALNPKKIEKVFTKPVYRRQSHIRIKRKNP
jgi:hypothetical protein